MATHDTGQKTRKTQKKLGRHSKATVSFRRNARRCQRTDEAVRRLVADWSIRAIRRLPSMEGRPFAAAAPPGRSTRPRPPEEKSPPERRRRRGKKNETKKKYPPTPLQLSFNPCTVESSFHTRFAEKKKEKQPIPPDAAPEFQYDGPGTFALRFSRLRAIVFCVSIGRNNSIRSSCDAIITTADFEVWFKLKQLPL